MTHGFTIVNLIISMTNRLWIGFSYSCFEVVHGIIARNVLLYCRIHPGGESYNTRCQC